MEFILFLKIIESSHVDSNDFIQVIELFFK